MADIKHTSFQQPARPGTSVWRYMDLARFLWALQNNALYFSRSDLLGDPFEGYPTKFLVKEGRAAFIEEMKDMPKADMIFDQLIDFQKRWRFAAYVNCWHLNDNESAAMWKLYTSQRESVCIRSTYEKLSAHMPDKTSFGEGPGNEIFLGMVNYIDYEVETYQLGNTFNALMHKRKSFAHEAEIRAVFTSGESWYSANTDELLKAAILAAPRGHAVSVDLKKLIDRIYISPDAVPPLLEVVTNVARSFDLSCPVIQSEVNAPPAY